MNNLVACNKSLYYISHKPLFPGLKSLLHISLILVYYYLCCATFYIWGLIKLMLVPLEYDYQYANIQDIFYGVLWHLYLQEQQIPVSTLSIFHK